jgi:hypothetical protein
MCKVQAPNAPGGRYAKDAFQIDLEAGTVTGPARTDRPAASGRERAHRPLRASVPGMPARQRVHHLNGWALDPRRPLRATASACSRPPDRSGVEGRLHSQPPQGRAQDQSPDPTPTRRPPRSRPRAHQSRCRLQSAGGRGEPRATCDARCHPPHRRVGAQHRLTPPETGSHPPAPPSTDPRPRHPGSRTARHRPTTPHGGSATERAHTPHTPTPAERRSTPVS